jgi:periplasmic divalent cation tolerance protein
MATPILVMATASSREEAQSIAKALVEERLVACVNIVPGVHSLFTWEGNFCDEDEVLLIMKTHKNFFPALVSRIKTLHSYDVPEVIALPILDGSEDYLAWMEASLT